MKRRLKRSPLNEAVQTAWVFLVVREVDLDGAEQSSEESPLSLEGVLLYYFLKENPLRYP